MDAVVLEVTPFSINQVASTGPGALRTILSRYQLKDIDSICAAKSSAGSRTNISDGGGGGGHLEKKDSVVIWHLGRAHWFTFVGDSPRSPGGSGEAATAAPSADFYGAPQHATLHTAEDKCRTFIERVRQHALGLGAAVGHEEEEAAAGGGGSSGAGDDAKDKNATGEKEESLLVEGGDERR